MKLLSRAEWGASYDVNKRPPMRLPVSQAFCHHTVTKPTTDPAADMREVERIDIQRFGYPSYSWVIHPTGVVLEGMGTHIGAHTIHNNSTSFGISFIGNFENDAVTDAALEACVTLLAARVAQGHLTPDFRLGGHRDVFATACPGEHLYPLIPRIRAAVSAPEPAPTPNHLEDDVVIYQRPNGNSQDSYLLHAGKLVFHDGHETMILAAKGVPVVEHCSDKTWNNLVKTYGNPVVV